MVSGCTDLRLPLNITVICSFESTTTHSSSWRTIRSSYSIGRFFMPSSIVRLLTGFAARPQATTFAEQKCCSKKKDTPTGVFLFGAGDEARWRPCRAATRTRAPKHATGMFFSLRSCPFEPLPDLTEKNTILTDGVSFWSGRRGSNSLPRPWQGRALPDELRPHNNGYYKA